MENVHSFESLGLAEPLLRALNARNYNTPTPIQTQAIPHLLNGADLLGSAQTGTGKTAAFTLPILHQMEKNPRRLQQGRFRVLVLTPTRELCVQVAKSFQDYGEFSRLSVAAVYGGVSAGPQVRALRRGVDVLIATPGRLFDLFNQGCFDFGGVEFFVLDEADRMLDMGFIHDIRKVVAELPRERQSLFFSATFNPTVRKLAGDILKNPVEVHIAPEEATAEAVNHRLCLVEHENKSRLLQNLIAEQDAREGRHLTLVFSRTKHGAERMAKQLKRDGVRAEAIHGNKTQNARQRALENFRTGKANVLVATDVAARGIDVKNITLVINFDLPDDPEAYVHRIGRTARGGASGTAFSFCTGEDFGELRAIENFIKAEIELHRDHEFHDENLVFKRKQRLQGGSSKKKRGGGQRGGFSARGNSGPRGNHAPRSSSFGDHGGSQGGQGRPQSNRRSGQRKFARAN